MNYRKNILQLIGNTPLMKLERIAPGRELYAKCEFMNPLSVKDRPVLQIIDDAEREGKLKPGQALIECTSGNTGMAVAMVGAVRGYPVKLVMSEIQSLERRQILKALGAELILTPKDQGTVGARKKMREMIEADPDLFYVGQHINSSNPRSHYLTTGPEIWSATDGIVDVLVAGLGTGGTICGAGKFLKERKASVRLVAVEPEVSPFISKGIFKPHRIMGTAPGFYPEVLDREIIDEIMLVTENDAFSMCRRIAREEGVLVGISSGAVAHVALNLAQRDPDKMIVCIFADSGQRYLSVEGLFDR